MSKPKNDTVPAVSTVPAAVESTQPADMAETTVQIHAFDKMAKDAYARLCDILPKSEIETFRVSVKNKTFDGSFKGISLPDNWSIEQVKYAKYLADIGQTYAKLSKQLREWYPMRATVKGMHF